MHALVYIGTGLWICVGLVIFGWILALFAQLTNNRIPKAGASSQFQFQSNDPADYTERGRHYLKKLNRARLVMLAYLATLFVVFYFAMMR
jgi:hypothetical protein